MIRIVLAALFACLLAATAAARESVLSYQSRIAVGADGVLTVTDTIRVRAEGRDIKRGIYRGFPTLYRDRRGARVRVAFDVLEVLRDGKPEPFHVESEQNGKVVYIGNANVSLRPGEYTYALTYRTDRQIGFFAEYDELYWNVTGADWTLPRDSVEAVVVLPTGAHVVQNAAYTGLSGQRGTAFAIDSDPEGNPRFRTTRILSMGEDLTVAVAWPKGFVTEPTGSDRLWYALSDNADAFVGALGMLAVLGVSLALWWAGRTRPPRAAPSFHCSRRPRACRRRRCASSCASGSTPRRSPPRSSTWRSRDTWRSMPKDAIPSCASGTVLRRIFRRGKGRSLRRFSARRAIWSCSRTTTTPSSARRATA